MKGTTTANAIMFQDTLVELLDRITTILDIKTPVAKEMKAEELLPTDIEGCFFGSKKMTIGTIKI